MANKEKRVFDISKFTVVGTPTITDDGVASGFSNANYITTSKPISSNNNIFKFKFKYNGIKPESGSFYYLSLSSGEGEFFYVYQNSSNALSIYSTKTGATSIWATPIIMLYASHIGTTFDIEVVTTSEKYTCNVYRDSVLLGSQSIATTNLLPSNISIVNLGGPQNSSTLNDNSIDLSSFSITVDGKEVFTGTKTVHLLEQRKKLVWDSSQFTEVGNLHVVDDYKTYLYKDNFKAQTGAGDCTAQVLNGGYIGLRSYQGYQPVLINFTGDTPFRLNQLVWRNNPDQGNQGYAPTFYTLTASNDDWATSVTLGTFTASAAKDEAKTFTWDVNSTTAYKSYNMTSDGRHTYGSDGKYALSITFISFAADYDKDSYDKVNGVASGFSSGSYLTIPSIDMTQPWEGHIDFSTTTLGTASGYINWGSTSVDNGLVLSSSEWLSFRTVVGQINSDVLKDNTKYSCIIGWSGTQYYLKILEYGTNEWKTKTMNNTTANSAVDTTMKIGLFGSTFSCLSSLNLKTIKFYQNNTLVFDGGKQTYAYDPSKFTVVGSPTITEDGILSNCSNGNAVNTKVQLSQLAGKSWAVKGSTVVGDVNISLVKLSSVGNGFYTNFGSIWWHYTLKHIYFSGRTGIAGDTNNEGFHIISPSTFEIGDKVYYTLTFDITTGTYTLYADKVDGTTYQGKWTPATDNKELYYMNTHPEYYISLGTGSDNVHYLTAGSVDMKDFSVEIEGEEIFTGTKPVHLLELRKEGFDLSKFTVVGSPTISEDGILSNCSSTDYVNTQVQLSQLAGKSWTVKGSITAGTDSSVAVKFSSTGYVTFGSIQYSATYRRISFAGRTGISGDVNNEGDKIKTPNNSFAVGDKIYYTLSFDITTGTYSLYVDKVTGTTLIGTWTATTDNKELYYINTQPTQYISFGRGSDGVSNLTTGSVDMSDFSVEIEGEEVFTGAKENYYAFSL